MLDTGLLYRAVGVLLACHGGDFDDVEAATRVARELTADMLTDPAFRTREAGEAASRVAVHPPVRLALREMQQDFARRPDGAVIDGRDIGTVIAPQADVKIFVTASPETRAQRRALELRSRGEPVDYAETLADIRKRDERDSGRASAPLKAAADAHVLDTIDLDIEAAVKAAIAIVEKKRG